MKEILIFSAGPAGRETFQLINSINRSKKEWKVIGYVDDLDRANLDDLKNFFLRWYGPNNGSNKTSWSRNPAGSNFLQKRIC